MEKITDNHFGGHYSRWSYGYWWLILYLDERYEKTSLEIKVSFVFCQILLVFATQSNNTSSAIVGIMITMVTKLGFLVSIDCRTIFAVSSMTRLIESTCLSPDLKEILPKPLVDESTWMPNRVYFFRIQKSSQGKSTNCILP